MEWKYGCPIRPAGGGYKVLDWVNADENKYVWSKAGGNFAG